MYMPQQACTVQFWLRVSLSQIGGAKSEGTKKFSLNVKEKLEVLSMWEDLQLELWGAKAKPSRHTRYLRYS